MGIKSDVLKFIDSISQEQKVIQLQVVNVSILK